MGFQMGSIDHQLIRLAALGGQFSQDPIEDAEPAPADEAIIDRLVRTILSGASRHRIPLRKTKMMPLKINRSSTRGKPCDNGKYGLMRRICASDRSIKSLIKASPFDPNESRSGSLCKRFNRS
jgi:hypothetical protein